MSVRAATGRGGSPREQVYLSGHVSQISLVAQMVESACNVGDVGSVPGLGRSPGGGHGNPLQYSCLEYSVDRGAWRATVCGVPKSQTRLNH